MSDAPRLLAGMWLRRSIGVTLLLVALVALGAGASMAAFAGALRSTSALDRFLEAHRPATVMVGSEGEMPEAFDYDLVESLPGVVGSGRGAYGLMSITGPTGIHLPLGIVNPFILAASKGLPTSRPVIVSGHSADPGVATEVTLDEYGAELLGVEAGGELRLHLYAAHQMDTLFGGGADFPPAEGPDVTVTVTGLHRTPVDLNPVPPDDVYAVSIASSELYLGPAFWERYGDEMAAYGGLEDGTEILLEDGMAGVAAFEQAVRQLPGGDMLGIEAFSDAEEAVDNARATVRFEAVASTMFGIVLVVAVGALVGQALARQVRTDLSERRLLLAMGLRPADLSRAVRLRFLPVAAVAAALAAGGAWLSSDLTPIGLGGRAETDPGRTLDPIVTASGVVVVVCGVLAWVTLVARRVGRTSPSTGTGIFDRLRSSLHAAGAPPAVTLGLAQLSAREGERSLPVRSALGAASFGVAGVVAAAVFTTSLVGFVDSPAEQGWSWDLLVGDSDDESLLEEGARALDDHQEVVGYASVSTALQSVVDIDGRVQELNLVAVDSLAGGTNVMVVDGRPAVADDEIVLGAADLAASGVSLGDHVMLRSSLATHRYRVVGIGLMHHGLLSTTRLDRGAVVTGSGLERLFPSEEPTTAVMGFLVDVGDDDEIAAVAADLREVFGPTIIPHIPPVYATGLDGARGLPLALGALVGTLGAATVVHVLLLLVRRRRAELAVLVGLGLVRKQLVGLSVTAATSIALAAVVVGVPAGVVSGQWTWRLVADGVGARASAQIPVVTVALVALAIVVVANAAAAVPGRLATRLRPAEILRAE